MNRPKLVFSFLILLTFVSVSFAQGDARQAAIEPSYDVILQIVVSGDDKAATQPLPQNLAGIAKQLKADYAFPKYRLANTYVGRISNGGGFDYKAISNVFGSGQDSETPSFWDWSLANLKSAPTTGGKNDLTLQAFRFGARIPVRTGSTKDDAGNVRPTFNYESIGLNSMRVTLAENTPTLIGSLSLPNTTGTVFLVLTLRPA